MQLVEKHLIKPSNIIYKEIDSLAFKAKNLYNSALYILRENHKNGNKYLGGFDMINLMKDHECFTALPRKVSQQVLIKLDKSYKAYFAALKAYKKDASKFKGLPKQPKFKHKEKGRFILIYNKQAINKGNKLSGTNISVITKKQNINEIRVIPNKDKTYFIEVVYRVENVEKKENNNRYCAIDFGVNNFMTIGSNIISPIIINGKPLKSMNQYYNKKKADIQEKLNKQFGENRKNSKKLSKLTAKRNRKISDYLHKATSKVVSHLVSNDITTLIVGYNKEWKQGINIGVKNNQNFTQIPFAKAIDMLQYKCDLQGISVIKTEESYTSKTSFLDKESPTKKDKYKGRRVKRGLFKSSSGKVINADLNGSLQILKKVASNVFNNGVEGLVVSPIVLTIK